MNTFAETFTTNPFSNNTIGDDHFKEECGVFGILNHEEASAHTALGLHALQHRGQEGAGVVSCDGKEFYQHRAFGKVGDKFNKASVIDRLKGKGAIGHNRYSTSGGEDQLTNIQPMFAEMSFGEIAVAHNGNLTNAVTLRKKLIKSGSIFSTTMDSEVVIHLAATSKKDSVVDCLIDAVSQVEGAYSMIALTIEALIGVRDPHGVRPLILGKLDNAYILCSETCALDIIAAQFVREIEPGEMVIIKGDQIESIRPFKKAKSKFCIFEYVYFSRPDSIFEGTSIYETRKNMGIELAKELPIDADVIIPVPDSGVPAAIGYSNESGIPFELGIIRNHYVGRTFIEPTDSIRHLGVKLKHNANKHVIEGKRVVLIDDSIVRGTTSRKIIDLVRAAGAKEVHMRISSPPTIGPCFYGVDTPSKDKLLASRMQLEEMKDYINADSLAFLSIDSLYRAVTKTNRDNDEPQYCDACFTDEYPIEVTDQQSNHTVK
jgi:amidophosphoribosyltransferase